MKSFIAFSLVSFLIFSCNSQKINSGAEPKTDVRPIVHNNDELLGKWTLEYMSPVNGKDVKELFKIQKPYLTFVDETKVAGNNGCNNIAGEYSNSEGNIIHFNTDKFISTKMFCEGFDESAFISVLKTINRYDVIDEGNKLVLLTGDIVSMSFLKSEEGK